MTTETHHNWTAVWFMVIATSITLWGLVHNRNSDDIKAELTRLRIAVEQYQGGLP